MISCRSVACVIGVVAKLHFFLFFTICLPRISFYFLTKGDWGRGGCLISTHARNRDAHDAHDARVAFVVLSAWFLLWFLFYLIFDFFYDRTLWRRTVWGIRTRRRRRRVWFSQWFISDAEHVAFYIPTVLFPTNVVVRLCGRRDVDDAGSHSTPLPFLLFYFAFDAVTSLWLSPKLDFIFIFWKKKSWFVRWKTRRRWRR